MLKINPDIRKAETLDSSFYSDSSAWDKSKELIFAKSMELFRKQELIVQFNN